KIEQVPGRREVSFGPTAERVQAWGAAHHRVIVVASSLAQGQRLTNLFATHEVTLEPAESLAAALAAAPGRPRLVIGHFGEGFRIPGERLVVLTETDLFGEARQRRRTRRVELGQLLRNLSEL